MTRKNIETTVLVLGGGLAGLSTAYHLKSTDNLLIERERKVGGTARSLFIKGFTFDFTGHLLHLHTPYTKKLIKSLIGKRLTSCQRNTWIFSENTYTPYPYQANTQGLPEHVSDACVLGFLEARRQAPFLTHADVQHLNFQDWSHKIFGQGISDHFMIPYNEKLFQIRAHQMTVDWCGPFVPMPQLEDVVKGAIEPHKKQFGYNATFFYPKKGGIQILPEALAKKLKNIHCKTSLKSVDWKNKCATLSNGKKIHYKEMVNTIPLLEFLRTLKPLPPDIKREIAKLKFASILCLNIGVKRPRISDRSWIYFPEKKYPFYRVGFPMNFTPHTVPKGCSSMYVEIPMTYAKNKSKQDISKNVKKGLIEAGILRRSDRLPVIYSIPIKYAYVIYDRNRKKALNRIFSFLSKQGIQSIGRYGGWKYSFMEEAILDGKKAAERITIRSR